MANQKRIELELTEAQKAQIRAATGQEHDTLELDVEELEERIAPGGLKIRGGPAVTGPEAG